MDLQGFLTTVVGAFEPNNSGSVPSSLSTWRITVADYTDPTLVGSVVHFQVTGTDTNVYSVDLTEGDNWTAGVSNNATATSLANNINTSGIDDHATLIATVLANVITVTSIGDITALTSQSAALVVVEL